MAHTWGEPLTTPAKLTPPSEFRSFTDPVILSTIPHYLALLFVAGCQRGPLLAGLYLAYAITIGISSTLSLIWHFQKERKNIFFYLDYAFALFWTIGDFVVAIATSPLHVILTMIFLNIIVLLTNQLGDYLALHKMIGYETGHAAWHLLSCAKAVFVAYLVGCRYGVSCAAVV